MAQIPFFLTGANAKIKLNGVTLAFCSEFTYAVRVNSLAPKVLGQYESTTVEPLSYDVFGSFSIVKYAKGMEEKLKSLNITPPNGISPEGDGVGNWKSALNGKAEESGDPSKYSMGSFFDIEIFQKYPKNLISGNQKIDTETLQIAKIRKARIIEFDLFLSKRAISQQRFTFQACYLDEDTFKANVSSAWVN